MILSFENVGPKLTIADILNHVTEERILNQWQPKFPKELIICSPFRKDRSPSFCFSNKSGRWKWKDFGTGDTGDAFDYVAIAEGTNVEGAMKIIACVFGITPGFTGNKIIRNSFIQAPYEKKNKTGALVQVLVKKPLKQDLDYFNRVLITPQSMKYYQIGVAEEVWLRKNDQEEKKLLWSYRENNPIYYIKSPLSDHIKCWRPYEQDKKKKWISNMDDKIDIMGYAQANIKICPGKPMIITKSIIEIGFFRAFGFNSIAQNSEEYHISPDFIRHLQKYCYPVISILDPDLAGVKGMQRLKKLGVPALVIPRNLGGKDPTDIWRNNYKNGYKLINLINEYIEYITGRESRMATIAFGFRVS